MPNVCSYGVTAAGPQQAVAKCYELLKAHLIDKDNAYGKYILDDEAMVGSESGQVVGVNELSLKEGSLGLYGSSSYCPPDITKYLAFAFPKLTFTVKGDTEYGDVVERWEVTAQGTRCLDMGNYDREGNYTWDIKDGINLKTGRPTEIGTWGQPEPAEEISVAPPPGDPLRAECDPDFLADPEGSEEPEGE